MAQIQKGTTYAVNDQVTASNLNAHVDNAVLLSGAVSEQTTAASVGSSDYTLIQRGTALYKAAFSTLVTFLNTYFLPKDGSTMTGPLVLNADPTTNLGAATKQYVDTGVSGKVNKAGDTMTGALVLSGDPTVALGAATKQYVDASAPSASAKMFVLFDGTVNPPTIKKSFNVQNVTKISAGNYTITFQNPLSTSNFILAGNNDISGQASWTFAVERSVNYVKVRCGPEESSGGTIVGVDSSNVNVVIFA